MGRAKEREEGKKWRTGERTAGAVRILGRRKIRFENHHVVIIVVLVMGEEDVDDEFLVGVPPGDVEVVVHGQVAAFDEDVRRAEALQEFGDADEVRDGADLGILDAGVSEEEIRFGDIGGQDGGEREEFLAKICHGVVGEELGSAGRDHDLLFNLLVVQEWGNMEEGVKWNTGSSTHVGLLSFSRAVATALIVGAEASIPGPKRWRIRYGEAKIWGWNTYRS